MRKLFTLLCSIITLGMVQAQVTLSLSNTSGSCGDTVTIPVTAAGFTDVVGVQFSLQWNATNLQYIGVNNFASGVVSGASNFNAMQTSTGQLGFAASNASATPWALPNGATLFAVRFIVIGSSQSINFASVPTAIEVALFNGGNVTAVNPTTTAGAVSVIDTQAPNIGCPVNTVIQAAPNATNAVVNGIAAISSDNCGVATTAYQVTGATNISGAGNASGSTFNVGTSTVAYTVTDVFGNTATCTTNITINANTTAAPDTLNIITGSSNVSCGSQSFSIPVSVSNFTNLTDVQFSLNWNASLIQFVNVTGLNLNSLVATDFVTTMAGNGVLGVVWNAPSGVTVPNGTTIFTINFNTIGSAGNSNIQVSNNNITIKALDPNGVEQPVIAQNGLVSIGDTQAPIITCPGSFSVTNTSNSNQVTINNLSGFVNDNCSNASVTYNISGASSGSGNGFLSTTVVNLGATNFTYTATDASGNSASCSFMVTAMSNVAPPLTLVASNNNAQCGQSTAINISVNNMTAVQSLQFSMDWNNALFGFDSISNINTNIAGLNAATFGLMQTNNGQLTFSWSDPNLDGETLPTGTLLFTLYLNVNGALANASAVNFTNTPTLIEASGVGFPAPVVNVTTASGSISVTDAVAPIITCPSDQNINATTNVTNVAGIAPISVLDNCSTVNYDYTTTGATTINGTGDASNAGFNLGVTTVTYTAADASNNTATCSFDITTVLGGTLTLIAQTGNAGCGTQTPIDISVSNFTDINSLQFTLQWDPNIMDFANLNNLANLPDYQLTNINTQNVNNGYLTFSWSDLSLDGETLPDNAVLFTLFFDVLGNNGGSSNITFTNSPTSIEASDLTFPPVPINVNTLNGALNVVDNIPPSIGCPANVNLQIPFGLTNTTVNNIFASVTDNCGVDSLYYSETGATTNNGAITATGTQFNLGTTTVVYTATDFAGNTATCAFNVTINTESVLTLIANGTLANCGDNSFDVPITIQNFNNLISLQFSLAWNNNQFVYTGYTDLNANISLSNTNFGTAAGSLAFSWFDTPGVTLANDDTLFVMHFDVVGNAGLNSNLNFVNTPTNIEASQEGFPPVQVPVDTINININIQDLSAPIYTNCPNNINATTDANECIALVNWQVPTVNDLCDGSVPMIISHTPPVQMPLGQTDVSYIATDAAGNVAICTFTITVTETSAPILQGCPNDVIVNAAADTCGNIANWIAPTATDNCVQNPAISSTDSIGSFFPIGTTLVTYTANDGNGNTSTCAFNVIVNDNIAPMAAICPSNIIANVASNNCGAVVDWTVPTFIDNCTNNIFITASHVTSNIFPLGTTNVIYTATDASGNVGTCSFTVAISDNVAPTIDNCPTQVVVNAQTFLCVAQVNWTAPTASDFCDTSVTLISNFANGGVYSVGTSQVIYTATDVAGNTSQCSFNVVVNDITVPSFTNCPTDIIAFAQADTNGTVVTWQTPTVTDACGANNVSVTSNVASGSFFAFGNNVITYSANDASGNTAICTFVISVMDTIPPTIMNCPNDITVAGFGTNCAGIGNWAVPTFDDNVGILSISNNYTAGDTFPTGTTLVLYTVLDSAGNAANCFFNVTVNSNQLSFNSCPSNITTNATTANCEAIVTWNDAVANSDCSGNLLTLTQTHNSGDLFPSGATNVVYTATDALGNSATCAFTITVTGGQAIPLICPQNITVNTVANECKAVASWNAITASAACGANAVVTTNLASGTLFDVGTTTVTAIASTNGNNIDTCTFTISVNEQVPPSITCPSNITVQADENTCMGIATWGIPTVTDNCDNTPSLNVNIPSGSQFPIGTTNVIYIATDDSGNASSCSFTVKATDVFGPQFTNCPNGILIPSSIDTCGAYVAFDNIAIFDFCSGVMSFTSNLPSGAFFDIGSTQVSITAVDSSFNSSNCIFNILVIDAVAPQFNNCPLDITAGTLVDTCGAFVDWTPPTAFDNCGNIANFVVNSNYIPGDFYATGTYTVTYSMSDTMGNLLNECNFNITVSDTIAPVINCPTQVMVNIDGTIINDGGGILVAATSLNCDSIFLQLGIPTVFDNCDMIDAFQTGGNQTGTFLAGTSTITYSAIDGNLNESTCNFDVMVIGVGALAISADNNPVCLNGTLTMSIPNVGANNITWTGPNGFTSDQAIVVIDSMTTNEAGTYYVTVSTAGGCGASDSIVIGVMGELPIVAISVDDNMIDCNGLDTLNFQATILNNINVTFQWDGPDGFSSTEQNPTVFTTSSANAGWYMLRVTTDAGCSVMDSILVGGGIATSNPIITAADNILCLGDATSLTSTFVDGADYSWSVTPDISGGLVSIDSNIITVLPTAPGLYIYKNVLSINGCASDTATILVVVNTSNEVTTAAMNDTITCATAADSLFLFAATANNILSWNWSGPNGYNSSIQNPIITNIDANVNGDYIVTATNTIGCIAMDTITINMGVAPAQPVIDGDMFICQGDNIDLSATTIAGANYVWTGPNNYVSNLQNPNVTGNAQEFHAGAYFLQIDVNGCLSPISEAFEIGILVEPITNEDTDNTVLQNQMDTINVIANDELVDGASYNIGITTSPGFAGTVFDLGNGQLKFTPAPGAFGIQTFVYTLCYDQCPALCDMSAVTINVNNTDCNISTVFTPNEDGTNDFFFITCLEPAGKFPDSEVIIFNEWGDEVYRKKDYRNDWDGKYNGKDLPDGTYYYLFKKDKTTEFVKGFITLFR